MLRYFCNSMTDLHKIWHDYAEHVSKVHWQLKISVSKIKDGGRPMRLKNPIGFIIKSHFSIFKTYSDESVHNARNWLSTNRPSYPAANQVVTLTRRVQERPQDFG